MKTLYFIMVAVLVVFGYFRYKYLIFPPNQPAELRNFKSSDLAKFDGETSSQVYLSFDGHVFDVSTVEHYRKGKGGYAIYAGHECAWAITGSDLKGEYLGKFKPELSTKDEESYDYWLDFYQKKYPHMGYLVDDDGVKLGRPLKNEKESKEGADL